MSATTPRKPRRTRVAATVTRSARDTARVVRQTPAREYQRAVENPVISAFLAFAIYAFATLSAFGIELTEEQEDALLMLAIAAVPVVAWVRSRVRPVAREEREADESRDGDA